MSRPIWEAEILQYRPTFVSAALGRDEAVRIFARNERGRDFVVGDIHGMYSALDRFLAELSFDPGGDRLFSVGDLIDRGPESEAALQWLTGRDWFHAIRGNHDQFLLDAAADPAGERGEEYGVWDYNGGGWWASVPAPARESWVRAFSALPFAAEVDCETGPVGIVHADVPEDRTWEEFLSALREGSREDSYHAIWSPPPHGALGPSRGRGSGASGRRAGGLRHLRPRARRAGREDGQSVDDRHRGGLHVGDAGLPASPSPGSTPGR